MWTKLDDGLASHQKLEQAALSVKRPAAYTRALGAFTLGLLHANRYLTDGFVPDFVFESRHVPPEDLEALVAARLFRADADAGGYWVHDFLEWNPSGDEVRAKQKRERERKKSRQGFRLESAQPPDGVHEDSARIPRGGDAESAKTPCRGVPGPARPAPTLVPPPTPPRTEGRRPTRATRRAALRATGPLPASWRDECERAGHTPGCHTPAECVQRRTRGVA